MRKTTPVLLLMLLAGCTVKPQLSPLTEAQYARDPDKISIEITDYVATPNRVFRHLFVSNFSVKANRGGLDYSTSRDGLTDQLKRLLEPAYGFAISSPDWNADGYSDLLMYLSGITLPNQSTLFCGPQQRMSASNDLLSYVDTRQASSPTHVLGLRDCEKVFLQLKPTEFDYDRDGIPDYLEIRNGLNPKNPSDANLSVSADGILNIEKVKRNIPIDEDALSQPNRLFAYKYVTDFDAAGARVFKVSNIPVLRGGAENLIAIFLTETDLTTRVDHLFSAFIVLDRPQPGVNIRFPFWANDPMNSTTNQEILEP